MDNQRLRWVAGVFVFTLLLPSLLGGAGIIRFTELSQQYQVRGYSYFGGHGCAWVDVNHDGKLDLFVKNQEGIGTPRDVNDILYINYGTYFVDEAIARGISDAYVYGTHGAVFAPLFGTLRNFDAFVTTTFSGVHPAIDRLYRNLGNGFFEDATSSIVPAQTVDHNARGVAVSDFDRDGDLDLYFSNPLPDPFASNLNPPLGLPNFLINNGKGTFTPMFRGILWSSYVAGVAAVDIDNDGDIDIAEAKWGAPSTIYLNDGFGNFRDAGKDWKLPQDDTNTEKNGVSFADIDNDGDMDLAIVGERVAGTLVGAVLIYKNEGDHFVLSQVINTTRTTGSRVGFHAAFGDFDHDGYLDMYLGGENVYQNDGTGRFTLVPASSSGMAVSLATVDPRGVALGDFDNDGDLDIYLTDTRGPNLLFRNEVNNSDWIQVEIVSDHTRAVGGFGSKVDLYAAGHLGDKAYLKGHREIQGEYGFLGQDQPIAHFGAPSAGGAKYDIMVTFLDGKIKSILNVTPGQKIQVTAIWPLVNFQVKKVENRALLYRETVIELSWEGNPQNLRIVKHRLYDVTQGQTLIAEMPATQFNYTLRNADPKKAYRFAVTAVDDGGIESEPAYTTSQGSATVEVSRPRGTLKGWKPGI